MVRAFREVKNGGATVLLVEQNFAAARALGDTVAIMDDGRVIHHGRMADLAADHALQQRLLGLHLDRHQ
jgi:branched-chain amino acid transport system ATP-binding protein